MLSFTFVVTAHALEWIKLKPVFINIDPSTQNVDAHCIAGAIMDKRSKGALIRSQGLNVFRVFAEKPTGDA
jgi:dTDP-4-amino-4,6-dideoxygalactose transaminase